MLVFFVSCLLYISDLRHYGSWNHPKMSKLEIRCNCYFEFSFEYSVYHYSRPYIKLNKPMFRMGNIECAVSV